MAEMFPAEFPRPSWPYKTAAKASVHEIQFDDGVVQTSPVGLNYRYQEITPTWENLEHEVGQRIYDWLYKRLKVVRFGWRHPRTGEVTRVRCTDLSIDDTTYPVVSITATLTER